MDERDLFIAQLLERQVLKETHPLGCGCVLESKYGHPSKRDWLLVSRYIETCSLHGKIRTSFDREKNLPWEQSSFIPKWRDAYGLWILREEWEDSIHPTPKTPLQMQYFDKKPFGQGVFEYKGKLLLLLVGYLGTPVLLGKDKGEKMEGRAICLDVKTGKTFPAPAPEPLMMRFGWVKEG